MALTEKQKRFCDEYLIDLNATQAAIRAGYSKRSARQIAERNMTKDDIQKYIKERMDEKEDELIADQDEVLRYLTATMRREKKECIVVTIKEKKSVYVPDKKKQTVEKEVPKIIEIPAKLSDANKAAELLGKRYALFTDKVETDVDMDLNITIDYGEDDTG